MDTYIGIITPDGVIETKKKKVSLTDIEVWEYGFSKAILHLCPKGWKAPLGDNWEDILRILVCDWSTYSYLGMQPLRSKEEFRCQFNSQAASLRRRIHMTSNVEINLNSRVYFVTTFHHPAAMESYHTESIYSFAA